MTAAALTNDEFKAIAAFCAEEVGRQYNGHPDAKEAAVAVAWMLDAWIFAIEQYDSRYDEAPAERLARLRRYEPEPERQDSGLTVGLIEEFGRRIEPEINRDGYRTCDIWIGGSKGMPPRLIRAAMDHYVTGDLVEWAHDPDQCYLRFEQVHPFGDGNGRSGKIIFNWLKGTLRAPTWPYNFWGISNP